MGFLSSVSLSMYRVLSYGEFKIAVGEAVSNYFAPIYSNFQELENEDISKVLDSNLKEAQISAEETINEVNNILGL